MISWAQMTRLASFGPVFVAAAHPKPPILSCRRRCCCGSDVVVVCHEVVLLVYYDLKIKCKKKLLVKR